MIAVVNFGSQFTHLIARRLRSLNVHAEVFPADSPVRRFSGVSGVVLSGGPSSVLDPDAPTTNPEVFDLGVPVLGICYGEQLMTRMLGGKVLKGYSGQYGKELVTNLGDSPLWQGLPEEHVVWFSHGDKVETLPDGFVEIGRTKNHNHAAIADESRKLYGLQFHPEVVHSEFGNTVLQNFALQICKDPADWTIEHAKDIIVRDLETQIGDGGVLVGVSGGVDPMVAATLLHELVPDRLHAVFVDHGLLRKDEAALFEIANKFALRHYNREQKNDYDKPIWLDWAFHVFLSTIRAVVRVRDRDVSDGAR